MAVGLAEPAALHPVAGVKLAACAAGLYAGERLDMALLSLAEGSRCAAVFTRNLFCAAPVAVARRHLEETSPRYLLINAGNANAGTGERGKHDAVRLCRSLADQAGCPVASVLPFSTGVIGEYLPVDRLLEKIPELSSALAPENWLAAARAIMTTDTVPKAVSRKVTIGGKCVTITGIAKGSGMIRPDMATMLAFITTDVTAGQRVLNQVLADAVDKSFNRISVDGDTSTNDACLLAATGQGQCVIDGEGNSLAAFSEAITAVCVELAQAIVRDGEGATKFITVSVDGGRTRQECLQVAFAISNSPLIKTALFASDPNWGRILAAIGRAGIDDLNIERVAVYLDDMCIVEGGMRSAGYSEDAGRQIMQQEEILIRVELHRGEVSEIVWTCDLSHEYVRINAEYRT